MLHVLLLAVGVALVYLACEGFLNAIEHLGPLLSVGPVAVGSVLAAVGTALPESAVTFVASVLGHGRAAQDTGVGAAVGGPLVLATVAYAAVGVVAWRTGRPLPADRAETRSLTEDQLAFGVLSLVRLGLGLVAWAVKPVLGALFLLAYAGYVVRELRRRDAVAAEPPVLPRLLLQRRRGEPDAWAVVLQTVVALGLIAVGSQVFVDQLEWAGPALGLPATVTALLLAPIATELPELLNAVLWMRQGKPRLALANVSGAMMIQATVPTGIAMLATPWRYDRALVTAGLVTLLATGWVALLVRRRGGLRPRPLALAGLGYAAFALLLALT